jgi:hypothetical protein
VGGAHDAEVAAIDCRYLCDVESFGGRDDGRINGAERKVVVLRHKLSDSYQVTGVNWFEREVAGRNIPQEPDFGLPSQASRDQVGHLGKNKRWDDQRAWVGLKELKARRVTSVVTVDVGVQRASVDDQRDDPASARRISSIRSEISL